MFGHDYEAHVLAMANRRRRYERVLAARAKGTHTKAQWKRMLAMTGNVCPACGIEYDTLTKDHVVPLYAGGSDGIDNIQPLCRPCNSAKDDCINWFKKKYGGFT